MVSLINHHLYPLLDLWRRWEKRHSLAFNTTGRRGNSVNALAAELVSKQACRTESFHIPGCGANG